MQCIGRGKARNIDFFHATQFSLSATHRDHKQNRQTTKISACLLHIPRATRRTAILVMFVCLLGDPTRQPSGVVQAVVENAAVERVVFLDF